MDVDPMEYVADDDDDNGKTEQEKDAAHAHEIRKGQLNTLVAITVALLATFMGICKVKDDNIVQAMQQEQAKSIDTWSWYQFRKLRLETAQATVDQLRLQVLTAPATARAAYNKQIAAYESVVKEQTKKMADTQQEAKGHDSQYDAFNYHDDQFDLADALIAMSISLLAMTSLTQKRWLYAFAMIPTCGGVLMGLAGLCGWHIHSDAIAKLLGT